MPRTTLTLAQLLGSAVCGTLLMAAQFNGCNSQSSDPPVTPPKVCDGIRTFDATGNTTGCIPQTACTQNSDCPGYTEQDRCCGGCNNVCMNGVCSERCPEAAQCCFTDAGCDDSCLTQPQACTQASDCPIGVNPIDQCCGGGCFFDCIQGQCQEMCADSFWAVCCESPLGCTDTCQVPPGSDCHSLSQDACVLVNE